MLLGNTVAKLSTGKPNISVRLEVLLTAKLLCLAKELYRSG